MSDERFRTVKDPRPGAPARGSGRSLAAEILRAGDSMGRIMRSHLGLARIGVKEEARKTLFDSSLGLAALPLALAGLLMLDVAFALGISSWVGGAWAFLIVGGINLVIAGTLGVFSASRLKRRRKMEVVTSEFQKDREMLRDLEARLKGARERRAARNRAAMARPFPPPMPPRDQAGRPIAPPPADEPADLR